MERQPPAVEDLIQATDLAAMRALVVEEMPLGISLFDADDRLVLANRHYRDVWQLPEALCVAGTRFDVILQGSHGARELLDLHEIDPADGTPRRRRHWQLDDGRVIEVLVRRLADGASLALHADITQMHRAKEQVRFLARHDALTGLPNRQLLCERIVEHLPRTDRGEELAVLCLDLDRFKLINDTLGHAAGDALLRHVADRVRATVRATDTPARFGADEFAVLQTGAGQPAGSTALARRLIARLSEPFDLDGQQVHIDVGVGVAVAPFDGADAETLLKNADLALVRAKAAGRGQLRYFEPEMDARMQRRRELEMALRGAVDRGEFELAFQAQVALPACQVVGVEALLRWQHPQRGRVSPADFVPLAEETGLITPIGRWVLREACRVAMDWPATVRVAVNVSAVQFKSRTLVQDVLGALQASGLPAERLELEITEAVLLEDTELALSVLQALRAHGIRLSMDDFGTGYSSLGYLRRFPFDRLKIDRSFVVDAAQGGGALAIIEAITSLGRSLGMTTTAEGVETAGQLSAVQSAGCAEVQGFLFCRPMPADQISALIAAGPAAMVEAARGVDALACSTASST